MQTEVMGQRKKQCAAALPDNSTSVGEEQDYLEGLQAPKQGQDRQHRTCLSLAIDQHLVVDQYGILRYTVALFV